MLATPQTQSLQFRGGLNVGGAGVVAFRVVVGAAVVVVDVTTAGISVGAVGELLSVATVAVSGAEPGRCGNSDRTHCTNVFWDCFSSGDAGVVPAEGSADVLYC